jgi:threonine dehydrogenase-like Zn-dependent dehydrogenase
VTIEQDYPTVSSIFGNAWTAVDFSGFDTVAVFEAGPVGPLAVYSAITRGASRLYTVEPIPIRLERAFCLGAIPNNSVESNPVAQSISP